MIVERLWHEFPGVATIVPCVNIETGEMRNLKFTPDTGLVRNAWEIDEPTHNEDIATDAFKFKTLFCFQKIADFRQQQFRRRRRRLCRELFEISHCGFCNQKHNKCNDYKRYDVADELAIS